MFTERIIFHIILRHIFSINKQNVKYTPACLSRMEFPMPEYTRHMHRVISEKSFPPKKTVDDQRIYIQNNNNIDFS